MSNNNNRQLLIDVTTFEFVRDNLFESTINDQNKRLVVKGILQRANVKNQNGRIYKKDILIREDKKYNEEFIKEKRALGELDHPSSEIINLQNVSHNIIETWWDGDNLYGAIEILSTPNGNILKELFKANIRLGISSRGMGTVNKGSGVNEEVDIVQDDFSLISYDFVSNPSVRGAFMFPAGNLQENISKSNIPISSPQKWDKIENIIRDILLEIK